MKELVRLVEGDASAAQRSLLEAARAHHPPNEEARARTLAALTAAAGGVALGSATAAATAGKSLGAGATLARALSPALLKWVAVAAVGTGVSASAVLAVRHESAVRSAITPAPALAVTTPSASRASAPSSPPSSVPTPERAHALPATPFSGVSPLLGGTPPGLPRTEERGRAQPTLKEAAGLRVAPALVPNAVAPSPATNVLPDPPPAQVPELAPTATTAPSASVGSRPELASLSPEVRMLDEARADLSSHDAAKALAALDRYGAAFPRGVFLPEARVLRIEALLLAGDRSSATRLADELLRSDPNGPYAQRVRKMIPDRRP